jgi:hypothetical protein
MIPTCYYNKSITSFIDQLIDDGYKSYDELLDVDKDILIVKGIELLGEDAYHFMYDSGFLPSFSRYLLSNKKDDGQDLVDILKESANNYFSLALSELFEERYSFSEFMFSAENKTNNWNVAA